MNSLRVCLAQIDVTVGALRSNADRMVAVAAAAAREGADLIAFPELALCGYPPEDLVLKPHFLADTHRELQRLAARMPPRAVVVVGAPRSEGGGVFNSAWVLQNGRLAGVYDKMLLPNYGVFDEKRLFQPGRRPALLRIGDWRVGLHICEDSWQTDAPPCAALRGAIDLLLNISGSPYHRGKTAQRERVLRSAARAVGAPLLYCNLVGGQDELVFDGASLAIAPRGWLGRARAFEEDRLWLDFEPPARGRREASRAADASETVTLIACERTSPPRGGRRRPIARRLEPRLKDPADVYAALRVGLRDYVEKNRFPGVIVGLSGGIDSALVAAIAVDALGPDRVHGITMPSRFSSRGTLRDAHRLARGLGIRIVEQPIERLYAAFIGELAALWPGRAPDVTEENLQARIRGVIVMALSNKFGWMVLTTGNKSETATGYCTLYGDMAGGFAVLKDVPKMLVYRLARWRNRAAGRPVIPPSTLRRAPSAELRAGQTDQDSLPPYPVLDAIIERYVERDEGPDEIAAAGFDPETVRRIIRLIDTNEYKRRQSAPGVKITPKAFGRDRRLPITNADRDHIGSRGETLP